MNKYFHVGICAFIGISKTIVLKLTRRNYFIGGD